MEWNMQFSTGYGQNCLCHTVSESHPNGGSPDCLHGDGDEAGDGVCQGQMEHQEVDVCAASKNSMKKSSLNVSTENILIHFQYRKCLLSHM